MGLSTARCRWAWWVAAALVAATYTEVGLDEIEHASLAQVIRDNTAIDDEIPDDVFRVAP